MVQSTGSPVGWGCRISADVGALPHTNKSPGYDTKQSHGEAPVMLELLVI